MPRPPQLCPAATLVNLPTPRKRGQDGSPRGKDTSFSPIPASTAGLTWRGYRSRGQTYGAGVPRERGSHVSNLQMGLVYLAAQETDGGGASVGGENLAFKGTPPGSKLGPGGGGPRPTTPLQLTCPAQEPSNPTLAPRHLWAPPHQPPPRFKDPHASSSPRSPSCVLTGRHPAGTPRVLPGSEGVVDLQPRLQRLQ